MPPSVKPVACFRWPRLLWLVALTFFLADLLYPVSDRLTRAGGILLFSLVWFGFIGLVWTRHRLRFALLGITVLGAAFLASPARNLPPVATLRGDYLAGLRRYQSVTYYWGGENPLGIDCSGLIRRGLVDSLLWRGLRTFDAGLVRHAFALWWNDCTARALGEAHNPWTVLLLDTPSLNELDHSRILPGDLAVSGVHIMAYLGDNVWIEADPGVGRVIAVPVPTNGNPWFDTKMKIVRWNLLQQ